MGYMPTEHQHTQEIVGLCTNSFSVFLCSLRVLVVLTHTTRSPYLVAFVTCVMARTESILEVEHGPKSLPVSRNLGLSAAAMRLGCVVA